MTGRASVRLLPAILLLTFATLPGCPRERSEYAEFFDLPRSEQPLALLSYPLEDQVAIYIEGVTRWHPPKLGLADPLASNGEPVIPLLLERLKRTNEEYLQAWLLYVLGKMSCKYNDLSGKEDVLETASSVVAKMGQSHWRRSAEISVAEIRKENCP